MTRMLTPIECSYPLVFRIMDPEESTQFNNNNNRTPVFSSEDSNLPLSALIPVVAIYGILIATTIIGNLFVIISYLQDRKLRQRPANLIILNLAFADFIIMDPEESTQFNNNNNRIFFFSSEDSNLPLSALIPVVAIYGILIATTIIGNLFVIISYLQDRKLRQRPVNLIILNLAFADFIVGLVSLTVNLTTIVSGRWLFGEYIMDPEESTQFNNRTPVLSSEDSNLPLSTSIPVVVIYGILIATTVIGNLFVIISYFQDRKLRQRPANLIILNLAFADLIVGLVPLTVNPTIIVSGRWLFGEYFCRLYRVIDYLAVYVSVVMIVFISIDRYLLVTKPIKHRLLVTRKRVRYAIMSAWITYFTVFILLSFGWTTFGGQKEMMDYSHECLMEYLGNPDIPTADASSSWRSSHAELLGLDLVGLSRTRPPRVKDRTWLGWGLFGL
eukprot:XP_011683315.1 PREDICTED: uncharacterized protein LOC105447216 [Strongylocentrotus purpuratus]